MGRPIQLLASTLILAMTSASGVSASGASGVIATHSINLPTLLGGAASTQVKATAGVAATNMFTIITTALTMSGKRGIEFWVHVDGLYNGTNPSVGGTGTVALRSAGATATLTAVVSYRQGWNHIKLGRADFSSVVGGADFSTTTFVDVTIKFDGLSGVTPVLTFAELSYLGWSRSPIAWVFDDGYQTVKDTAYPILSSFGMPGTVGVISSLVGTSGKMPLADLNTLYNAGWAMCNHSATHGNSPFLQSANQATCYTEIATCKAYIEAQGWLRDGGNLDYISPYGEVSEAYRLASVEAGMRSFWGLGSSDYASAPSKPSFSDRGLDEAFPSRLSLIQGATTAQVTSCLDRSLSAGRGCVILLHSPVTVPSINLEVATATLQGVCEYLHRKRAMCDFVTLPQMFEMMKDPTK